VKRAVLAPVDTPTTSITPADEDRAALRAIRRRTSTAERAALAALGMVASLFVATRAVGHVKEQKTRAALLATYDGAVAPASAGEKALRGKIAARTMELSSSRWDGDVVSPVVDRAGGLASVLSGHGLYLRIAQPLGATPDRVREGVRASSKDAFASCFYMSAGVTPERTTTECADGSACIGDLTGRLANVRGISRGLELLDPAFREDLQEADGMRLGVLASIMGEAPGEEVARARGTLEGARYFVLVVDEVDEKTSMGWFTSAAHSAQAVPHAARIALFDLERDEVLARVRLPADQTPETSLQAGDDVRRQVQGCGLGMDAAARLSFPHPLPSP
jgi:hypothetical protein